MGVRGQAGGVIALGVGIGLAVAAVPGWSMGAHYEVEDATMADAGRCEVDAWYQRVDSNDQAFEAELVCNPTGVAELTLGVARVDTGSEWRTDLAIEAKTLFRQPVVGGWGWGLVGISSWSDEFSEHEALELIAPLTVIPNDRVAVHFNVGAAYQANDRDLGLWGVATDISLREDTHVIAEAYGSHRGDPEYQIGLRQFFGQGKLDLSFGWEGSDTSENWFTVGVGWVF